MEYRISVILQNNFNDIEFIEKSLKNLLDKLKEKCYIVVYAKDEKNSSIIKEYCDKNNIKSVYKESDYYTHKKKAKLKRTTDIIKGSNFCLIICDNLHNTYCKLAKDTCEFAHKKYYIANPHTEKQHTLF